MYTTTSSIAKRILSLSAIIALLFSITVSQDISTAKTTRKNAYMKELSKKKYKNGQFAVQDLNADGTPELIVNEDHTLWTQSIFTYKKGKIKKIKQPDYECDGEFKTSKSRKTFAWVRSRNQGDCQYTMLYEYKLSGTKTKFMHSIECVDYLNGKVSYSYDGKETTKKKYNSIYKKFNKSVIFHSNTKKNRKKWL